MTRIVKDEKSRTLTNVLLFSSLTMRVIDKDEKSRTLVNVVRTDFYW